MGLRSEIVGQDLAQTLGDLDDFDFEAVLADPDNFDPLAEKAVALPDQPSPTDPVRQAVNVRDMVGSLEAEMQRYAEQLAAFRPVLADIRGALDVSDQRETRLNALETEHQSARQALETANVGLVRAVEDLETTRATLEEANKKIRDQAEKLETAERSELSLRDEIAALAGELAKARETQAATTERLDKITAFCRRAHAAMKSALGERDEMEIRMKRHQAGESSALRRVAELSTLNEELETRLRLPPAKPRPAPHAPVSEVASANDV